MLLRNFAFLEPGRDRVSGFVKFRWPVKTGDAWHYLPVKEHPFYSEEQYSAAFSKGYADYFEAVGRRIDPNVHDPGERAQRIIATLTRRLNERIPIVLDGNRKCRDVRCPEGSRYWEMYSTADRDEFVGVMVEHLEDVISRNHLDRDALLTRMAEVRLQISSDRYVTLRQVLENSKWLSSDPGDSIEARWGLDKCGNIALHLKGARESISFIQKKYGRTNPQFARREISSQQKIVDEMTKESLKNNCAMASHQN